MGNVAGVMKKVNDNVSTEEMAKIMQQFAVENEKMGMSEEMMDDALIDAVSACIPVVLKVCMFKIVWWFGPDMLTTTRTAQKGLSARSRDCWRCDPIR